MAEITAALVMKLREETGQPMMDCKAALVEAGGDKDAAAKILREKGKKLEGVRLGRDTEFGRIGAYSDDKAGAIVELLCESAPVANGPDVRQFAEDCAKALALAKTEITDGETLSLKFTENNAEVPAASAYNDVLNSAFFGLPVIGQFLKQYSVRTIPTRHSVMHVLLDSYREWGGSDRRPQIAILDWDEVPTRSEFELFVAYFRSQGLTAQIVDPRTVEYRQGALYDGDYRIDLIYKRVLITELIERLGVDNAIVQAVRNHDVCMVNPFTCKLLYKKASLAVLSDERNADLFAADETVAISEYIPWTRVIEERMTTYKGLPVDLIPFIQKYREQFVLKPNDDYGGRGIVLGWQTNSSGWEAALQTALETPHVVQERVTIPTEPYPSMIDGKLQIFDRMLDTAPFVFHGEYTEGCLTRLSTDPLLNVSAGGGSTVPTFIVEKRE